MSTLSEWIGKFAANYRWGLFGLALLALLFTYGPSQQLSFDRSLEQMFSPDDPDRLAYERLKADFGSSDVVLLVYSDEDLFDEDGEGIKRLAEISGRAARIEGVREVLSLAEISRLIKSLQNTGSLFDSFQRFSSGRNQDKDQDDDTDFDGPAILNPKSALAKEYLKLFEGYTHGSDRKTAAVACMLRPESDGGSDLRAQAISDLTELVQSLPDDLEPGVLAGEPVMVVEGFSLLEQDGRRLGFWSTVLLGIVILICFRSLRWLVTPIAVVQWALLSTQAVLVYSGLQLTMVSSMLAAIITVVGVATVVHLVVRYRELDSQGLSPKATLAATLSALWLPILGACATDAVGFGSLWLAEVGPVQDFGTMMVIGSLLVIPAVYLLAPLMATFAAVPREHRPGPSELAVRNFLRDSATWAVDRSRWFGPVLLVLTVILSIGSSRLSVETDFTRNFRSGSRLVQWYAFVETRLGGAGVWDLVLGAPPRLTKDYLDRVRTLEDRLRALRYPDSTPDEPAALTKVISLVDALDAADADQNLASLPRDPELRLQGMTAAMPSFMQSLRHQHTDEDGSPIGRGSLRIMLRSLERQPANRKAWLIGEVQRLALEAFPQTKEDPAAAAAGSYVLLTRLIESMLRDQWVTFGAASIGIAVMLLVTVRSLSLTLVALVPNAFPIFVLMGMLGWFGLKLNMGAAMIAAVSMGLSVDSSIHYLLLYLEARGRGKHPDACRDEVQESVGLAALFSTIALIAGFGVLLFSEFVPTIYFGALVSLAMIGGLVGNLIVLPLLLNWLEIILPNATTNAARRMGYKIQQDEESASPAMPAAGAAPRL
ncbi:exporter of the RND superfamily protein-like protein [Pirellula staleyi DSM 6068]|uniref:Exporter of the RND superfamily protein-like protein n=1 Tax=Pirellula staleyi (strain ATCC 27377 / DSM 6068 / ICPB 4128) TaxID=530564 RepID=D2R0J1_PIRSD|nr:MMPL family transporter [Pirellula staleyi]ADB14859.1 exporter of the RND superfamily protein-like protein [Pirellula staleyi DSM 6068]